MKLKAELSRFLDTVKAEFSRNYNLFFVKQLNFKRKNLEKFLIVQQ